MNMHTYYTRHRYEESDSVRIDLQLLENDLNDLKGMNIGSLKNFTWLTLKTGAFSDRAHLPTPRILSYDVYGGASMQVSTLTKDSVNPELVRFTIDSTEKKVVLFRYPCTSTPSSPTHPLTHP